MTGEFAARPAGVDGVVHGLSVGPNVVRAVLPDGRGARITLTDAPLGGPVFSGPQIQPWTCSSGARDAQCNRPPTYAFSYKSTSGGSLRPYDPKRPPSDVATTTTDQGHTVPFIVRQETGVSVRDEYRIAVLYDPAKPWDPTAAQPGYNHKLVLTHGASCDTAYQMGTAPDVLLEDALGRGFAVASHALHNAGHNSGAVDTAAHLDQVAIIDLRGPDFGSFHDVYRTYSMRERLLREHGTAANQVLWRGQVDLIGDVNYVTQGIQAMDRWLSVVERDRRVPLARKILDARRTAGVTERCTDGNGHDAPAATCDATVVSFRSPRISAGAPVADDTLKCQLVPLDRSSYGVTFTDAQWARMEATFPSGVCDYAKPSVGKQQTVTWLGYDVAGGRPLGAAPVSTAFRRATTAAGSAGRGAGAGQEQAAGSGQVSAAGPGRALATTGGSVDLAAAGLLLLAVALLARRRRIRVG